MSIRQPRNPAQWPVFGLLVGAFLTAGTTRADDARTLPPTEVHFERLGAEQGLSQGTVRCIAQDRTGYMWFGTEDGLNKFDGHTFTVYRHDPEKRDSLPNNSVSAIYEDHAGVLWIGTSGGGLSRFLPGTESFQNFRHDETNSQSLSDDTVSVIYEDRVGTLWVGTELGGLNQLDRRTLRFSHFRHSDSNAQSLADDNVQAIWQNREGALWVGTMHSGLDRLDVRRGNFTHFRHDPRNPKSLSGDAVRFVYEDGSQTLWVGTDNGLNKLDRSRQQVSRDPFEPKTSTHAKELKKEAVLADISGGLWIGTGSGLERYGGPSGFACYRYDPFDPRSLSDDDIRSLYRDRSGNLWVGTGGGGLSRYNPNNWRFTTYRNRPGDPNSLNNNLVKAVYKDRDGTLWIGTDGGGLTALDHQRRVLTVYRQNPVVSGSLASDYITALFQDASGALWVGTAQGLDRFDLQSRRFAHFKHDPLNAKSLSDDLVFFIYQDRRATLWVGTQGGLDKFEPRTNSFVSYKHDPSNINSVGENDIRAIAEDADGTLWIGTRHAGLERFDPRSETFKHYRHDSNPASLSNNAVYSLLFYRDGLWVGTTEGINLLNRSNGTFRRITSRDGLANDTVYSVLGDGAGNLWISTDNGLTKFTPATDTFRNYDVSDGLQGNEFNGGAAFQSPDGEMFFGGINGLNSFYPDQLKDSPYQPPVIITSVRKVDRLTRGVDRNKEVSLSPRDYIVSAEFAALDYTAPRKSHYAYRLQDFDRDWHYSGTSRLAIYTNLDPGNYEFHVKATNADGVWSSHEALLVIHVIPPLWRRWWFLTLAGSAFIVIVGSIYQRRIAGLQREKLAQENFSRRLIGSQEAERKRIAAELHDSLGQDLLVIKNHALLGIAIDGEKEKVLERLNEISATASLALDEVREISRALRPYQLDRLGLKKALESICKRAADSSPIKFLVDIDAIDRLFSKEDEINLFRVVQESVNNILKHSEATEASIVITRESHRILVIVEDNGKGFDSVMLTSADRAGFGLVGIAERARILGAKFTTHATAGLGTRLTLEIPLRNEHAQE